MYLFSACIRVYTGDALKILLFGISNVGKTTIGAMLAKQLDYSFYDLDEEVKKEFQMTLEGLYIQKIFVGETKKEVG